LRAEKRIRRGGDDGDRIGQSSHDLADVRLHRWASVRLLTRPSVPPRTGRAHARSRRIIPLRRTHGVASYVGCAVVAARGCFNSSGRRFRPPKNTTGVPRGVWLHSSSRAGFHFKNLRQEFKSGPGRHSPLLGAVGRHSLTP
jgi:hypothetical protein